MYNHSTQINQLCTLSYVYICVYIITVIYSTCQLWAVPSQFRHHHHLPRCHACILRMRRRRPWATLHWRWRPKKCLPRSMSGVFNRTFPRSFDSRKSRYIFQHHGAFKGWSSDLISWHWWCHGEKPTFPWWKTPWQLLLLFRIYAKHIDHRWNFVIAYLSGGWMVTFFWRCLNGIYRFQVRMFPIPI